MMGGTSSIQGRNDRPQEGHPCSTGASREDGKPGEESGDHQPVERTATELILISYNIIFIYNII